MKKLFLILAFLPLISSPSTTACDGTTVVVNCYDAENFGETGVLYGRVCDNTKCARAYFDLIDGEGRCSYCNENEVEL